MASRIVDGVSLKVGMPLRAESFRVEVSDLGSGFLSLMTEQIRLPVHQESPGRSQWPQTCRAPQGCKTSWPTYVLCGTPKPGMLSWLLDVSRLVDGAAAEHLLRQCMACLCCRNLNFGFDRSVLTKAERRFVLLAWTLLWSQLQSSKNALASMSNPVVFFDVTAGGEQMSSPAIILCFEMHAT